MKLEDLFSGIETLERSAWDGSQNIPRVLKDSRAIQKGDVFVACRGANQDGHDFIADVAKRGAVVIIYEKEGSPIPQSVTGIRVKDTQLLFPELLKRMYRFNDHSISILGVTGTNGKTTITQLLYRLLSTRFKAGTIGTLSYALPSGIRESDNTTPGPETLIPLLAEMVSQGAKYVSMEVSSHALEQRRVAGLHFELAIFTQLTQDHLDYHHDLESYFQAKRRLFSEYKPERMLINRDCPYGRRLLAEFPQAKSFSVESAADYQAVQIQESLRGCRFGIKFRRKTENFEIQLPLHYNISNCLAVLAGLDLLGLNMLDFAAPLSKIPFIPGRMERVPHDSAHIFVDYAHTPDAFLQVLKHVRMQKPGKIITVFGCGGDRDRGKRPKMTRVAADFSDVLVLTSDNPRTEDPKAILEEMKTALTENDRAKIQIIEDLDRAEAIRKALKLAEAGDALLILGKGHEDYQIIGKEKHHFSDREVVLEALSYSGSGLRSIAASDSFAQLNCPPHSAVQSPAITPFSIDTRTLKPGDLFVALDGANQKGQAFLAEAFMRGAAAAICAAKYQAKVQMDLPAAELKKVYFTEDPAAAMAALARAHRDRFAIEAVGITGSVGKTSTKEFLSYLLSRKFNLLATQGNLNNHLGLPISLSRLNAQHQVGVFEMGANHAGDIAELVKILNPTRGILVPIGPAHLAGFGSLENIYDAKLEILQAPGMKTLVTVDDDPALEKRLQKTKMKIIRVGFSEKADICISQLRLLDSGMEFKLNGHLIKIPMRAPFLAVNAALAAAMALELGVAWSDVEGSWDVVFPAGRFLERQLGNGVTVIDDTYNASPRSVQAAIKTLGQLSLGRRGWLIFSDMLELGNESEKLHRDLAGAAEESQLFGVWAFGEQARFLIDELNRRKSPVNARWFENCVDLADNLTAELKKNDLVLLKGSRGMRVERVLAALDKNILNQSENV